MRRFVWLLLLAALAFSGWVEYRHSRRPMSQGPLLFVLAPPEACRGLTSQQRQGFALLFKDCLEFGSGLVVEDSGTVLAPPQDSLTVSLSREGDRARLHLLLRREGKRDQVAEIVSELPRQAVREALAWFGLEARAAEVLLPLDPARFWELAALAAGPPEAGAGEAAAACGRILDLEPRCAGAWLTQGRLLNARINAESRIPPGLQDQCEKAFLMALALVPECPRAAADFGRFRTDSGNHRAALDLLFGAIKRQPRSPRLYEATAYAARSAGLLEGAALALAKRDALLGPSRGEAGLTENTYLYLGDLDRFEKVLGPGPDPQQDPVREFYRGYSRLLRGDRDGARDCFAKACRPAEDARQFRALAKAYGQGLAGEPEEALAGLRGLWAERIPVRVPDGEFTFKVAEAFAFLGSPGEAQDVANRAFAQGFACTRWYQKSPFLESVRGTLRWNALEEHLRERQVLIEATYPRERFLF